MTTCHSTFAATSSHRRVPLGVGLLLVVASLCSALKPAAVALAAEPEKKQVLTELPISESDREHWAFQPLRAPQVPQLDWQADAVAPRGAIDCFILEHLKELELELAPVAEPLQLLRRLSFDLTGLPPSAEARQRFLEHHSEPDAFDREVDRLLASPAFGEHMAQAWLDLARFAETDGFEHDKVRPEAWRYRNWVIDVLNDDMPYDRFMRLQVAGDLTDDPSGSVATMFCLSGPDMPDINDQQERRHNLLNEMTGTVGAVFLGLQLGCAACHDHKFDPISQADFYRLRGVLESGVPELKRDKPWNVMQQSSELPTPYLYHRGDHRLKSVELVRSVPRITASERTLAEVAESPQPRLALADWLSSSENPLPARTMANRIWQSHFGRALAATPSDFGLVGIEPSHPELLDWLASELKHGEWSIKRLRRQMLLSATYQQTSLAPTASGHDKTSSNVPFAARLERDPENRAYSRYPRRRLTGEMLRDAMLSVSRSINRQASGRSVMPPLPKELLSTILSGHWKVSQLPADHYRRSMYVFARRNLRYPIFETFDRPDAGASCPERGRSVTATQSLLLFNSEFSLSIANALAEQAAEHKQGAEQAESLWQSAFGRSPTVMECELLSEFVEESSDKKRALVAAALALLNSNEFVIVD